MRDDPPPCPFCGNAKVRIVDTTFETFLDGDEVTMDFADCQGCHLSMPVGNYRTLCERLLELGAWGWTCLSEDR